MQISTRKSPFYVGVAALAVALVMGMGPPSHALTVRDAPYEVLLAESELAIEGAVVATEVEVDAGGRRWTRYTVVVERFLRWSPAATEMEVSMAASIDVVMPGGSQGGVTTRVYGVPTLRLGQRLGLLLERVRGEWTPLGYRLGVLAPQSIQTTAIRAYVHLTALDGSPARWEASCHQWWLDTAGADDLVREVVEETFTAAFSVWNDVEAAYPKWGYGGATCGGAVGVEPLEPRNILVFREAPGSWPHPLRAVALTSTTIDDNTGFIIDADVEFNGEHSRFAATGDPEAFDLRQIATHEIGHMLGLDHTPVAAAVMYYKTMKGETDNHDLHPDDVAGLVASHPLELAASGDECVFTSPVPLIAPLCPVADDGCEGAPPTPWALVWSLAALACLVWWRRLEPHRSS